MKKLLAIAEAKNAKYEANKRRKKEKSQDDQEKNKKKKKKDIKKEQLPLSNKFYPSEFKYKVLLEKFEDVTQLEWKNFKISQTSWQSSEPTLESNFIRMIFHSKSITKMPSLSFVKCYYPSWNDTTSWFAPFVIFRDWCLVSRKMMEFMLNSMSFVLIDIIDTIITKYQREIGQRLSVKTADSFDYVCGEFIRYLSLGGYILFNKLRSLVINLPRQTDAEKKTYLLNMAQLFKLTEMLVYRACKCKIPTFKFTPVEPFFMVKGALYINKDSKITKPIVTRDPSNFQCYIPYNTPDIKENDRNIKNLYTSYIDTVSCKSNSLENCNNILRYSGVFYRSSKVMSHRANYIFEKMFDLSVPSSFDKPIYKLGIECQCAYTDEFQKISYRSRYNFQLIKDRNQPNKPNEQKTQKKTTKKDVEKTTKSSTIGEKITKRKRKLDSDKTEKEEGEELNKNKKRKTQK